MAQDRFTVPVGERGRIVLPAEVRRRLGVAGGSLLVLELGPDDATLQVRRAADVAGAARGLFRDLAPGSDLAAELIDDRRREAEREHAAERARR